MIGAGALRRHIVLGWLLACLVLGLTGFRSVAGFDFGDPDDAMRLVEVRDWLAGQSWWDVTQYRMGLPGQPFAMHWSRLVDLPLAAVLVLADPFVAQATSDRMALTLVPLLTLLCAMALAAIITQQLADRETGRWAVLLIPLSPPILLQIQPMRIDHHGWQIVLALAAAAALLRARGVRDGAVAGLSLAALVTISLEGLPVAAVLAGAATLRAAWTGQHGRMVSAMAAALFAGALALHLGTRGPFAWAPACDAVAPAWLAALAAAVPGTVGAGLLGRRKLRLAATAAAAGGALAAMLWAAPQCLSGPFATLDPLVRVAWYDKVTEGLPLWRQPFGWAAASIAMPLVGIAGAAQAAWRQGPARGAWMLLLGWLVPLAAYACLVNRAAGTANALAVPGAAAALAAMLVRARALRSMPGRLAATAGALLIASPGAALAGIGGPGGSAPTTGVMSGRPMCERFGQVRALAALPPALVLAPIDLSPDLLATTGHRAVAGGYHRNTAAIGTVIRAFTAAPAFAERAVRRSGALYLVGCPGLDETREYAAVAPQGLWARLERGERFAWLQPLRIRGPLLVWQVLPDTAARP